jgi:BirA family biotin operon repressor/biotin-[acetyl-CoA-carboxylase] ligase
MQQVHAGMAKHGMAYMALTQTAGKGQRGKTWDSAPGQNIAMSLVLEPKSIQLSQQFCLNMAIASCCRSFFDQYAGGNTLIKWPNDIYWNDRKAGGILIESVIAASASDNWKWAVVGIGII